MADRGKRREEANGIKTIDYELRDSTIICQKKTLDWELHMYSVCHNCVVHRVPQLPCSMPECLIIKQKPWIGSYICARVPQLCCTPCATKFSTSCLKGLYPKPFADYFTRRPAICLKHPKIRKKIYLLLLPLMLWRTDRRKEREQVYLFPPCADIADGVCRYICRTYPYIVIS